MVYCKISDEYGAVSCPKNGCSTICIQSLAYNENININIFSSAMYSHINSIGFGSLFVRNSVHERIFNDNTKDKIIFVFRDPIERFVSAYCTKFVRLSHNYTIDEVIEILYNNFQIVKDEFDYNSSNYHYDTQFSKIGNKNLEKIHTFINIKDYEQFCKEHNIPYLKVNQTSNKPNYVFTDEQIEKLRKIYDDDYKLIEYINQSNRLYVPQNK